MKKIERFEENRVGRDFVVGDLHGCLTEFNRMLAHVGFNDKQDRVFSVGDLVDRGPDSMGCAKLLRESWFFAVKGNHEELMYESVLNDSYNHMRTWEGNGGSWYRAETREDLEEVSKLAADLPLVIAVGQGEKRFNVVHGELYHEMEIEHEGNWKYARIPLTNKMIDDWIFPEHVESMMTWGRTIISGGKATRVPWHDEKEMSLTFCGHTPVREVVQFGRQVYIDTGACFYHLNNNKSEQLMLTLAEPTADRYYSYRMLGGVITEHKLSEIEKWAI